MAKSWINDKYAGFKLKSVQKVGALHTFLQISHDLVKQIKQMRPCWKDVFKWDNMIIKIFSKLWNGRRKMKMKKMSFLFTYSMLLILSK